jgi:hypothetical protein
MPRSLRPSLYRTIKVRLPVHPWSRTWWNVPRQHRLVPFSQVVLTDGSTFRVPAAVRMVSKTLQLERDPHNHPVYLVRAHLYYPFFRPALTALLTARACVPHFRLLRAAQGSSDQAGLMTRREEARLERLQRRSKTFVFEDE